MQLKRSVRFFSVAVSVSAHQGQIVVTRAQNLRSVCVKLMWQEVNTSYCVVISLMYACRPSLDITK